MKTFISGVAAGLIGLGCFFVGNFYVDQQKKCEDIYIQFPSWESLYGCSKSIENYRELEVIAAETGYPIATDASTARYIKAHQQ